MMNYFIKSYDFGEVVHMLLFMDALNTSMFIHVPVICARHIHDTCIIAAEFHMMS